MEQPKSHSKLKLKLNVKHALDQTSVVNLSNNDNPNTMTSTTFTAPPDAIMSTPSAAMSPPVATPASSVKKFKISLKNKSQPPTPAGEAPPSTTQATSSAAAGPVAQSAVQPIATVTKAGRTSKPTAKKRAKNDTVADGEGEGEGDASAALPAKRARIKLAIQKAATQRSNLPEPRPWPSQPQTITIKDSHRLKAHRDNGSGYDSEMEGAEKDPIVEEQIVFRMLPGAECDYLHTALDGKNAPGKGMEFKLKWLEERRACVTVKGSLFAGVLVDLPTITEGMKTWDKKMLVKSADICQMLLVFARVKDEREAKTAELPKMIFDGYRWPHGLTPPMHDCVHRRFRKRLTKKEIANKEKEVERLLEADRKAVSSRWEWVDDRRATTAVDTPEYETQDADADQDAEGDMDVEYELERELEVEIGRDTDAPNPTEHQNELTTADTEPPATDGDHAVEEGSDALFGDDDGDNDEDEEEEDGDDDEDSEDGLDSEEKQRRDHIRGIRQEIGEINVMIRTVQNDLDSTANSILKKRLQLKLTNLKEQVRLKLASIGEKPDDDDD